MTTLNQMGKILTQNTNALSKVVGTTQRELSAVTGVSRRTIQRIEAARRARRTYRPMMETVVKLANASGVGVDDYIKTRLEFQ